MSLIEGDTLFNYPLFSSSDIPIDLNVHNLTESPRFHNLKKLSQDITSPQIVPNNNGCHSPSSLDFSLLMSGGIDKCDFTLNANLLKGLQMTDDNLFQSGLIQNPSKPSTVAVSDISVEGGQFISMPSEPSSVPVVPEYSLPHNVMNTPKAEMAYDEAPTAKSVNSKKRKASPVSSPPLSDTQGVSSPVESGQPLSADEERNMKRQRRLVKNREAAQLFRQRQKAYIQDLEKRVSDLSGTNNEYRARIELLNSENKLAKEQLMYLRNFVAQAIFPFPNAAQMPDGSDGSNANYAMPPGVMNINPMNMSMANIQGLMAAMGSEYMNPATLTLPGGLPIAMSPHLTQQHHPGISQGGASVPHTLNLMANTPVIRPLISPHPLSPVSCVPDSDDRSKMGTVHMSR